MKRGMLSCAVLLASHSCYEVDKKKGKTYWSCHLIQQIYGDYRRALKWYNGFHTTRFKQILRWVHL